MGDFSFRELATEDLAMPPVRIVGLDPVSFWVPVFAIGLLATAFVVNVAGNRAVEVSQRSMAAVKIVGLGPFAVVGLWFASAANVTNGTTAAGVDPSVEGFLAAAALAILAYKRFTTIINSGGNIVHPHRNTGRAIVIALVICTVVYLAIATAVAGNLTLPEILAAEDFSLAEAARPALGGTGVWFTVILAIVATASGVVASVFASSRLLAMLTRMKHVPRRDFRLPGTVRIHATVYTVAFAMALAATLDLSRIAALGAIYYLIMDITIHWGLLTRLRTRIDFKPAIVLASIVLDVSCSPHSSGSRHPPMRSVSTSPSRHRPHRRR